MSLSPAVSVVIPVRNAAGAVVHAVESCLSQEYDGSLEVVVADGISTDGTREQVAGLAESDHRLKIVDNPDLVTPAALNRAIRASSGTIIVRCDAHAVLPPGYVRRAVDRLTATGAASVGGVQRCVGTAPVQRSIAMAMSSPLGVGDATFRIGGEPGPTDTVYLGTFRRDAIEAAGLFDVTMLRNQDYELNYRLRKADEVVWFDPELAVDYFPRRSFGRLWRQYFDYGAGKRRMLRRHPESLRWRQLAAPALVLAMLASAVPASVGSWRLAAIVPAVYATALIGGAFVELLRRRDLAALLYPVAVATMHLSWGAGFLMETIRREPASGSG